MIIPGFLQKGDKIGVTATSGGVRNKTDELIIDNAIKNLNSLGYSIIETENVRKCDKLVSSSAKDRAKEFYKLWCDPDCKLIIAAAGGEFLMDMIPYLDKYNLDLSNPKWVQGYSDTSLLLLYLTTKYNIATVHGPNFGSFGRKEIHPSFARSLELISGDEDRIQKSFEMYESTPINWQDGKEFEMPNFDSKVEYKSLFGDKKVHMQGRLIGGCIDALRSIVGTPYSYVRQFINQYSTGMIWYLENCEMNVCDLYRTLWQMRESGWFENANGFLIGRTMSQAESHGFTYEDALKSALEDLEVPVIYDVDVGHTCPQWIMINGSLAKFDFEEKRGKIEMDFA